MGEPSAAKAAQTPSCPRGLEALQHMDQVLIRRQKAYMPIFSDHEKHNRYVLCNNQGQQMYYGIEYTNCCGKGGRGGYLRPFELAIMDASKRLVLVFQRPGRCDGCCCRGCSQRVEVYCYGHLLGSVEEIFTLCLPTYFILDPNDNPILRIDRPSFIARFRGATSMNILLLNNTTQIGRIYTRWYGAKCRGFEDLNYFGISFPVNLDVRLKAVLLGACFLMDYLYFEDML